MNVKKKVLDIGYKILNSRYFSKLFSSYKMTWELAGMTKHTAMDSILYNVKDEASFWESGKKDCERFMEFINKDSVVLDVGCGIGRLEKFLTLKCQEIHGIDVSGRMINFAKNNVKYENVFFYKNNGKDLSIFPDNKFDLIFSILTLQHLEKEDSYNYIKEMHRVLKTSRIVYIQVPNFLNDEVFLWFVNYAETGSRHIARVRGYTVPEVKKIMTSVGFEDLEINVEGKDIIVIGTKCARMQ